MNIRAGVLSVLAAFVSMTGCDAQVDSPAAPNREPIVVEPDKPEPTDTVIDAPPQVAAARIATLSLTKNAMFGYSASVASTFTAEEFRADWDIAKSSFDIIGGTGVTPATLKALRDNGKIFAIQTNEIFTGMKEPWAAEKVIPGDKVQQDRIWNAVVELRTRWLGFFAKHYDAIVIDEIRNDCFDNSVHAAIFSRALAATHKYKPAGTFIFVQAVESIAATGASFEEGYQKINPDRRTFGQMLYAVEHYTDLMFIETYRTPFYKKPILNAHRSIKSTLGHLARVNPVVASKTVPTLHVTGKDVLYKYCNPPCPEMANDYLDQEWGVLNEVRGMANGVGYWVFYRSDHALVSHVFDHHGFLPQMSSSNR